MRKALMGLIMAATVLSPLAAQAQEWRGARGDRGGRAAAEQRSDRQVQRSENRAARQEARQQRIETRQEAPQQRSENRQLRVETRQQRSENRQQRIEARQEAQAAAVAQRDRGDRGGRDGDGRNWSGRQSAYPDVWQGNPNDPARRRYEELERRNQYRYGTSEQRRDVRREVRQERREDRRDWRQDRREDRRDWRRDRRDDRRDWRNDRRDWRRDWNRDGWRHDRRYDWRNWRYRNRHIFRLSPYYSPYRNWNYRRFSIGLFLQPLFYSQRYWIGDPWYYRLPPAPIGTQWVRYYNDVLLVDTYSGEVIDVIYDFFW